MSYSDENYGPGDPDCPYCHGLGYVRSDKPVGHPQFGKIVDCKCRMAQAEIERQGYLRKIGGLEHLSDKTFDTFQIEKTGLPLAHQDSLQRAYSRALEYADQPERWLLFMGSHGSGKTHLAAAIANQRIKLNESVIFTTVPDLLDRLRASFDEKLAEDESYPALFEEVRKAPLLILDDLGTENQTSWAVEKLFQILNHRYNAHLPTVITTSRNLSDINEHIRSRLADIEVTEIVVMKLAEGEDSDFYGEGIYSHLTFETFKDRPDLPQRNRESLQRALRYAMDFAEKPEGWLVFFGTYGCGKTHLAAAIANYRMAQGREGLFVTAPDLLDYLRSTFAPNSLTTYGELFQKVRKASVLILDDLGTETATPWAREKLEQLFNDRYNAQAPTLITTSYKLEDFEKSLPRLVTRMRDQRICRMFDINVPAYIESQRAMRK